MKQNTERKHETKIAIKTKAAEDDDQRWRYQEKIQNNQAIKGEEDKLAPLSNQKLNIYKKRKG